MILELPYPPSVNHYYKQWRGRTLISEQGREYRREVTRLAWLWPRHELRQARLVVRLDVFPPDHRRRDLDNLAKSLLDSLIHAGIYDDDGQIDDLRLVRRDVVPNGKVIVTLNASQ